MLPPPGPSRGPDFEYRRRMLDPPKPMKPPSGHCEIFVRALLALTLLSACGSTSGSSNPTVDDEALIAAVRQEGLPGDPGSDAGGVGGKALEDVAFADGLVTFDEYERVVLAAMQCVRNEGFNVEGPFRYPHPNAELAIEAGTDPTLRLSWHGLNIKEEERFGEVTAACQAQWSHRIEQVWLRKNAPTQDEIETWLERAWECATQKGLPVSDPPTEEEALNGVHYGCRPWESRG